MVVSNTPLPENDGMMDAAYDAMGYKIRREGRGIRRHSRAHHHVIPEEPPSFPRRRESGCAVLRSLSMCARCYGVSRAVRARRSVEPAATSRPPARKSRSSSPPDMPAPPALGSSSGGMGVGVGVAVAVGTGVRVGVIVGGGVGVGVLVATMSYEPAAGRDGVGVLVGVIVACGVVACGVPACVVACGVAVRVG